MLGPVATQLTMKTIIMFTLLILNIFSSLVHGHGWMKDPVNRASRWRKGFSGPKEWTDNQLFCGGQSVQWNKHGGKCGVCGDEYGVAPRFAYPGDFARNAPIVKTYNEGQQIDVKVLITANHKGFFTFRVAPLINPPIKQEELDKNVLKTTNGDTQWQLPPGSYITFTIPLQLPVGVTCRHCVLQWWYSAGNNNVNDKPETFVNCADIAILPVFLPGPAPAPGPSPPPGPSSPPAPACPKPVPCPLPVVCPNPVPCPLPVVCPKPACPDQRSRCLGVTLQYNSWCKINCARGFCPKSHCICN